MKLKENIFTTLLLAIGLIMHHITPGFLGGMKFDFLLIFMFISLILNPKFENTILTGILSGILSALTTTFPAGQIPNLIDKLVTSLVLYIIINFLLKFKMNNISIGFVGAFGTLISGMTFLISAAYLTGLPGPIYLLFKGIVIPTIIVNTIGTVFIYNTVKGAIRKSGIII